MSKHPAMRAWGRLREAVLGEAADLDERYGDDGLRLALVEADVEVVEQWLCTEGPIDTADADRWRRLAELVREIDPRGPMTHDDDVEEVIASALRSAVRQQAQASAPGWAQAVEVEALQAAIDELRERIVRLEHLAVRRVP